MPIYTIELKDGTQEEILCSWEELQELLKADPTITHTIQPVKIIGERSGQVLRNAGDGWKDLLGKIKKGSAKDNTIRN